MHAMKPMAIAARPVAWSAPRHAAKGICRSRGPGGRPNSVRVAGVKYSAGSNTDDLFSLLGIEEKDLRQTNVPSAQPPAVDAVPPPPVTPPPAPELGPPAPIKAIQPPVPASSPEPLAAAPAPEAVQDQASEVLKAAKEAPKAASDAMEGLSSAAAESITQVQDAASAAAADVSKQVAEGLGSVQGAASSLAEGVGAATGAAADAASSALGQAKEQLGRLTSGLKSSVDAFTSSATSGVESLKGSTTGVLDEASSELNSALDSVNASISAAGASAATAAGDAVNQAISSLPEPVADALRQAAPAIKEAAGALSDQPIGITAAAAAAAFGVPAAVAYSGAYGGFAGFLSREKALEILQTEEALLVDIRTAAEREAGGIPELRSAARVKAVAVPVTAVDPQLKSRVEGSSRLMEEITAAQIVGLASLKPKSTKVIVMDRYGNTSRSMARTLRDMGIAKPYVLEGGFAVFAKTGAIEQKTSYDATQLQAVADDIIAASEDIATKLKNPVLAAGLVAGSAAGAYAIYNYHATLEYIGVLSLLLTFVRKLASYDSPQDFFEEVGGLVEKAQALAAPLKSNVARATVAEDKQE